MSIRIDTKRSIFFKELDISTQKKYFDLKSDKYLHKIDTLYYSVFIKNDNNEDSLVLDMITDIRNLKDDLITTGEESLDYLKDLEILRGRHSDYAYRLSIRDCYDIYVCSHIRNSNTPRILVQIRSMYLWKFGTEKSLYDSYNKVFELLKHYNIEIDRTQENRIDYAYHTNAIQSPNKFFNPDRLANTYKGGLRKFQMIGILNDDKTYSLDYVSLGSPKSNNVFFRIYNKTREVIEMNYKAFFFEVWYENGLINFYDKYCLEYAYLHKGDYDKIYEGSLKFYLEYGTNQQVKNIISNLFKNTSTTFKDIKDFSVSLMPNVTKILNIEFETKRKYYYYYQDAINLLPSNSNISELDRVFKIVNNSKIFLDMLTYKVVRFEENNELLSFWKKLRSLKIKSLSEDEIKATYSNEVDFEKIKNRVLSAISSYSVYKENLNDDIAHDIIDFLADLNDNCIQSNNYLALDGETGEILDIHNVNLKENYKDKKNKKYKQIKNRLKI